MARDSIGGIPMKKREVTKESIGRIMRAKKPASISQLARHLGYRGSPSGSLTKKIRKLMPGIDKVLKMNAAVEEVAGAGRKQAARKKGKACPRPECSPFRKGTLYDAVFSFLYANRTRFVSRQEAIDHLKRHPDRSISKRPERCLRYGLTVVTSGTEEGTAHKSIAGRHSDLFWTEKRDRGQWLKIRLRKQRYPTA